LWSLIILYILGGLIMNISSLRNIFLSGAALLLSAVTPVQAATTADVLFVVDESGSMSGEHSWISSMVSSLDSALTTAGVTGNRFGLVGFGGSGTHLAGHAHGGFGTVASFTTQASTLVTNGSFEDGYSGIDFALNNFTVRGDAALNVILITDEDRDILGGSTNSFASILAALTGKNALLNAVINASFDNGALGTSSTDAYFSDGSGGFTSTAGAASVLSDSGSTKEDYVDLALATGGAAWNLNLLRAGGLVADSFTQAFIDIKVAEIIIQPPSEVPVPAAAFMFAPALLGFFGLRRKAKIAAV
jgi:hypothetical protein